MNNLLEIKNLSVEYKLDDKVIKAVSNINLTLNKNESLGIIGESGSGKTSLAMSIMKLISNPGKVKGKVYYKGKNIYEMSKISLKNIRWNNIAMVFQNNLDVFNPVLTIYEQINEVLIKHLSLNKKHRENKIDELLKICGLNKDIKNYFPHELSGGMRQRILIAMALSCDPEILIVDEPTTALDAIYKNEIIDLILKLQQEKKFALLVISHELETIYKLTNTINVMYSGYMVETGPTVDILKNPIHTYTRGLIQSSPTINPYKDMWGIPFESNSYNNIVGCPFKERCTQSIDLCNKITPELERVSLDRYVACNRKGIVTILKGENINKKFKHKSSYTMACHDCNIEVKSGEIIALIGESGSGKSTLSSILSGIIELDSGTVMFENKRLRGNNFSMIKHGIQMVFQDPFSSINERFTIAEAVAEPLVILKNQSLEIIRTEIKKVLKEVQLPNDHTFLERRCYTLSGGQRQRVSLARSLIMKPKLLIADEITSMLDPSTKANIVRLLKELQNKNGFSMIYVTHDLPVARKIADRIYVMNNGKIIENGVSYEIFSNPLKEYTKKLVKEAFIYLE